jgi:hypothetical protein
MSVLCLGSMHLSSETPDIQPRNAKAPSDPQRLERGRINAGKTQNYSYTDPEVLSASRTWGLIQSWLRSKAVGGTP